jgi:UDP-2,3-diacylglucosamine hydrolase
MIDDTIYFIADAHLGAPFPEAKEWERRCIDFLRRLPGRASALYVLGDLFDFWIEYRNAIRADYFPVVHELKNLVDRGIPVHYFAGNHDFALGPFVRERLGITVYPGEAAMTLQGKRVRLYHGDGLLRADVGYRLLKRLLRNSFNQSIYKFIFRPGIGIPLASFFSGTSRRIGDRLLSEKILDEYRERARDRCNEGSDIVFLAHTHHAELSRWGDKIYCNPGSWMRNYTYATMNGGSVRLWRYREEGDPEELPAVDRK